MSHYCTMTKLYQKIKEGTTTVWETYETKTYDFTEQQYENYTCPEARKFFRNLGGCEYFKKSSTQKGYKIVKCISTRPDRKERRIATFDFS